MGSEIGSMLFILVIVTVIYFVLFLVLREVICWYLKINKNISLMEEQNELLKEVLKGIQKQNSIEYKIATSSIVNSPVSNSETKDFSYLSDLTKKEIDLVNQLYSGLNTNEVIVKHVANGTIQKMSMKDYNDWIKYYDKKSLILLVTK